ncbi:MAG: anti-virulence regulator CigR family protein [Kiloniellales bacterium]|nr:anti-virulence regulator CigR family protein [Kiloniellales bacterium]
MRFLMTALVAVALVAAGPALAGKKNKGNGNGKSNQPSTVEKILTRAVVGGLITVAERAIIGDYVAGHRSQFAGATALPPGIARKVARGGALPPGIAKKTLPGGLLSQLPARPGQEWRVVGTDLLIVEIATGVIVDVLKDAL